MNAHGRITIKSRRPHKHAGLSLFEIILVMAIIVGVRTGIDLGKSITANWILFVTGGNLSWALSHDNSISSASLDAIGFSA